MHAARHVAAAAAPPPPSPPPRPPVSSPATKSSARRAADVVVLGSSLQAYAAAYLLAKRGKRTVLVEHAAPQLAAAAGPRADLALHLPAATPHLVNEATESLALWRGVEAASGARDLLHLCGSIDMDPTRGSSAGSEALGRMQDASKAAGLQFGVLSPEEVSAAFPRLRPPRGTAALYTPLGGVVHARVAARVLRALAQRAGADVARGRCLLGWRDGGSHFAVRAGAAGEDEGVWEAEQLLLLPDAAVQQATLGLFGLAVPEARLWRTPASRWQAQEECASVPVWQLLATGATQTIDDPAGTVDSCWGFPVLDWSPGGVLVAQSLADGGPAEQRLEQQGPPDSDSSSGGSGGSGGSSGLSMPQLGGTLDDLAAAAAAEAGLAERPGSEEAIDAELARLAAEREQQELAGRRLARAGELAGRLLHGVGGRLPAHDGQLQCIVTPDGEPAVGSHPGFETGRLVAAFPAAGCQPGCLPGGQLAPLVARLAVSELLGQPDEAVDAAAVALAREALAAEARALPADSWAELSRCL